MRVNIFIILMSLTLFSCKNTESETNNIDVVSGSDETIIVGADKDKYGCLTTAGYTWSVLNEECIRLFEVAFALQPVKNPENNDAVLVAYALFSQDGMQAEVFFPGDEDSKIFIRVADDKPWIYEEWRLIANEGFILKENGIDKYIGDAEPGPKVTGSDRIED